MAVIATQRGSARRIVALALFALIPLVFGVLALVFLSPKQNDTPVIAPEATLTLRRPVPLNRASGDAATLPTGRPEHGSR